MSSQKALQEMDDNEFLAKVDTLMEYLERQVGDDSVGDWAVSAIKNEIRRRIMERHAVIVIEPEKIKIEITPIELISGKTVHPPARVTFYDVFISHSRLSWSERCASQVEVKKFLRGIELAATFGLAVEKIPDIP